MCLAEPKKAIRFAAIATVSSVAGGLFGYAIGYFLYEAIGAWVIGLLGLGPSAAAREVANAEGLLALADLDSDRGSRSSVPKN